MRLQLALIAASVMLIAACAGQTTQEQASILNTRIVTGVLNDAPGISDGALNPAGFDIDVMNKIGQDLNLPTTTTPLSVPEREGYLKGNKASVVIAAYSITDTRNRSGIDFAGPYMVSQQGLLVKANDSRITNAASLSGKSICAVEDSTGAAVAIPGTNQNSSPATNQQCVTALQNGAVDGVFNDTAILYGYTHAFPGQFKILFAGVYGQTQYWGVGLLGGHRQDCLRINEAIRDFVQHDWRSSFQQNLPDAAIAYSGADSLNGNYESQFKPKDTDSNRLACKL